MNVLALETTLGGLTLALQRADGAVFSRQTDAPRSSSQLHPLLADLLAKAGVRPANIAMLGVTIGPGSFTGARVAVAVAEAWGLAHPLCRLVGLQTLAILAAQIVENFKPHQDFRVLADAAGGMVYAQDFTALGQPRGAAECLPLASATATALPRFAMGLLLLEGVEHLPHISPKALLAALGNTANHRPLEATYLKPLAYKERETRQ